MPSERELAAALSKSAKHECYCCGNPVVLKNDRCVDCKTMNCRDDHPSENCLGGQRRHYERWGLLQQEDDEKAVELVVVVRGGYDNPNRAVMQMERALAENAGLQWYSQAEWEALEGENPPKVRHERWRRQFESETPKTAATPPEMLLDAVEHHSAVEHPSHYTTGKIEVWDFIIDQDLSYCNGNVVKYVCRAGRKDPDKHVQDLEKARAYLDREIERVKEQKR